MRRKLLISLIIIFVILILGKSSYAMVQIIPSKTGNGKDAIVNISISDSYIMCKGMKTNTGESLKGTGVDVHLATNKDWGAVSYLSNSIYGTNGTGEAKGIAVTISGVNYYSTTTNITGVMNWGANPNANRYTQTAGLLSDYTSGNDYVIELYNNRESKYVEYIDPTLAANTKGMAMHETTMKIVNTDFGKFRAGSDSSDLISLRLGLFGGGIGTNYVYPSRGGSGAPYNETTFRPVIWN